MTFNYNVAEKNGLGSLQLLVQNDPRSYDVQCNELIDRFLKSAMAGEEGG